MTTNNTQALEVYEPPQAQLMIGGAQKVATVCREIVLRTSVKIGKSQHVSVQGWNAIATAHGCIASSRDVKKVDGGYTSVGEIRRISDGKVLAEAEGFVGMDEPEWARRPEYACRAMAQTRAISRACRAAFAHVVVMIDDELSVTPAEEVPAGGFESSARQPERVEPSVLRRSAPVAVDAKPANGSGRLSGFIKYVKATETKKPGKFRYGILIVGNEDGSGDGQWVNTFDKAVGEAAEQNKGAFVQVTYKETQYGKDIEKFELQQPVPMTHVEHAAPAPAKPAPAQPEDNQDDVPF